MRSCRLFFLLAALVLCLHSVAAAPQAALRRQEDGSNQQQQQPTPSITRDAPTRASATAAPSDEEVSVPNIESNTAASKTTATPKPLDSAPASSVSQAPESATSVAAEATSSPEADRRNQLPFEPTLTPAMGLAGVILLTTGLAYAVIGIKNKW